MWTTIAGLAIARADPCARPIDAPTAAAVRSVAERWVALFGAPAPDVPACVGGRVGLPFAHVFTAEEIEAEWARESLDTPERREKAVAALGPSGEGGAPVYAHFWGADAPMSDMWGTSDSVGAVLELAAGWWRHCVDDLSRDPANHASPATCTLQVGDLGWYRNVRPDPLGHTDHGPGDCVDVRLFRTDGSRYEAWWNRPDDRPGRAAAYNGPLTHAFLAWAVAHAQLREVLFNDPAAADLPLVQSRSGHDDHIHICFGPRLPRTR